MAKNKMLNEDLRVIRVNNGVKLVGPACLQAAHSFSIASLKHLPFSFYFLNTDGETQYINEEGARVCGFATPHQSLGKSLKDVTKSESAARLIRNCSEVIESGRIKIFEEENQRKDEVSLQFLSVKAPWYDDHDQVIGIMGCSIVVGQHSLSESLSIIQKLGLMDTPHTPESPPENLKINNVYLSSRELQCLKLTVKGYTAKRIAKQLDISHRTVEEYIANIRVKTGAANKAELIEMTLENFYSH